MKNLPKLFKEKTYPYKTIIISKLVKEYKDKLGSEHVPICFLVTIKDGNQYRTMFRADTLKELWKLIEQEGRFYL